MFSCKGLGFRYNNIPRLCDVEFEVFSGELVALFGHNGSGKSTLQKLLSGVLPVQEGDIFVAQESALQGDRYLRMDLRRRFGVLFQDKSSDEKLSCRHNLIYAGKIMGLSGSELHEAVDRALRNAGLSDRANDQVKKLSGGLRRRLEIYRTFMHEPEMVLLDEPTAGLDLAETANFFTFIKTYLKKTPALAVMATHHADELLHCDRVIMLKDGRIVANAPPAEMLSSLDYMRASLSLDRAVDIHANPPVSFFDVEHNEISNQIRLRFLKRDLETLLKSSWLHDERIRGFSIEKPTLGDAYQDLVRERTNHHA